MKLHTALALAIAITALLGSQRAFAQTAVEALPNAGAPRPEIVIPAPNINMNSSAGEPAEVQDVPDAAPESDTQTSDNNNSSDNDPPDSGGWTQVQPNNSNTSN